VVTRRGAPVSASLRNEMVASLEQAGAIRSQTVRHAFLSVPRELFVPDVASRDGLPAIYRPELALATATDSRGIPISSSSAPMIMALMLEALDVRPGHRVLEVGAGTGYNAALLKSLVGTTGRVVSADIEPSFANNARRALSRAGYRCRVVVADGREGWLAGAPYDRIIVTASADQLSRAWRDQLTEGGQLELPLRLRAGIQPQVVVTLRREGDVLRSTAVIPGVFMALRATAGSDSPVKPGPALRAWSGTSRPTMLASLEGEALANLSPGMSRRMLALVLGKSRRLRTMSSASGLGLVMFLSVSAPPDLVRYVAADRFGVAIVGPSATSIVAVTSAPGRETWIEAWGDDRAEQRLTTHLKGWARVGNPTLEDLQLAVSYTMEPAERAWRTLRGTESLTVVNWASAPAARVPAGP
jgi:protein-L-isoaspartate(D-aspartate) O-methyltransferase